MKDLISFLVNGIIGSDDFEIIEESEDTFSVFTIKAKPEYMGLIIGKGGKTIKTIRNLVKVKATLEKKTINLLVEELT